MIGHETMGMMFGGGHRWRITLNTAATPPSSASFVQERSGTKAQDAMIREATQCSRRIAESQQRIAAAVAQVYDYLSDMADEERTRFATWLLDEVSIVRVRVSEYAVAYKVFQSLNHRGKPLSDHDILKSALFERAGFTTQEASQLSERWNAYTGRLSDRGFADMWKQIRAIYDREGAGEMVSALIAGIIPRSSIGEFLNNKLPRFVEAYDAVVNGVEGQIALSEETRRRICYLRSIHHESWRAPAIMFLVEQPYDPDNADRFFWALERLAYTLQYSVRDREYRHKRYRRVLDSMEKGVALRRRVSARSHPARKVRPDRPPSRPLPQLQTAPRPADARLRQRGRLARSSARHRLHGGAHPPPHATARIGMVRGMVARPGPRGADRMHRQLHPADPLRKPGGRPQVIPGKAGDLLPLGRGFIRPQPGPARTVRAGHLRM
jgi:predicted nucleic acid-binding protein